VDSCYSEIITKLKVNTPDGGRKDHLGQPTGGEHLLERSRLGLRHDPTQNGTETLRGRELPCVNIEGEINRAGTRGCFAAGG